MVSVEPMVLQPASAIARQRHRGEQANAGSHAYSHDAAPPAVPRSASLHPAIIVNPKAWLIRAASARVARRHASRAAFGDFSCIRPSFHAAARRPFRSGSSPSDTYAQVREQLGAAARRFAETAKFEPKPGQSLLLPGPDGALSGVLFGLEPADKPEQGSLPAGTPARPAAEPASTVSPTRRTTRALPRSAFALGCLRVHALPQGGAERRAARTARRRRRRGALAHRRGRGAGARPDQHAGQRSRPRRARGGGARPRARSTARAFDAIVGDDLLAAELPADPRGRPRRGRARRG